ncbi:Nif3-like dinuclear metal center hexameric protein [Luminiphilus sp. nBUS_16]|uniref:Nif3-like dinuclear metal center hexameric protein n=1 Tax=Luminiphilus sp. nBUS_16 TaxID=3395315 RepID=UPI003EC0D108
MGTSRQEMRAALDALLEPQRFKDFAPNGLQVEGREKIETVVSGVTASQALLDAAVALEADAVLVHHGYFWRSEDPCLVGMKGRRVRTLMQADISLFAYHLPLDCHPELGNNAGLGRALGVAQFAPLLPKEPTMPVFLGELTMETPLNTVAERLSEQLERPVLSEGNRPVQRIAWCTGGGQGYIDQAADAGADLFVTGEVSEQTIHIARERDVGFIAAGHHATERFGVQSVGHWLSQELGVEHHFVDDDNPA